MENFENFHYSETESSEIAEQMFTYLNPKNKPYLEEEEILKILKIAYSGLRTPSELQIDDIMSYLNFHGGSQISGKLTFEEFKNMTIRLLSQTEKKKIEKIQKKKNQNFEFCEDLKKELILTVGNEAVENELKSAIELFEKYDSNKNGFIEDFDVPQILIDTYKAVGVEYEPTEEDVYQYIEMMDLDKDGRISRVEYEIFVLNSLRKQEGEVRDINKVF